MAQIIVLVMLSSLGLGIAWIIVQIKTENKPSVVARREAKHIDSEWKQFNDH